MAYVNWIYVLPEFRHQSIARQLFNAFEKDCKDHRIDQFYLIRIPNSETNQFYERFAGILFTNEPLLRKDLCVIISMTKKF